MGAPCLICAPCIGHMLGPELQGVPVGVYGVSMEVCVRTNFPLSLTVDLGWILEYIQYGVHTYIHHPHKIITSYIHTIEAGGAYLFPWVPGSLPIGEFYPLYLTPGFV